MMPRTADLSNTFNLSAGWCYFMIWTVSFYPQLWVNFRRRSVVGAIMQRSSSPAMSVSLMALSKCALRA